MRERSCARGSGGHAPPGKFLKNWCILVSFCSFSESKFLVQKALFSTEKTQKFENDSSNGLVDKNMHTYERIQLLYYLFVGFIRLCLRLIVLSMSSLQLSKRFLNELVVHIHMSYKIKNVHAKSKGSDAVCCMIALISNSIDFFYFKLYIL